jgi:hypothetical protein
MANNSQWTHGGYEYGHKQQHYYQHEEKDKEIQIPTFEHLHKREKHPEEYHLKEQRQVEVYQAMNEFCQDNIKDVNMDSIEHDLDKRAQQLSELQKIIVGNEEEVKKKEAEIQRHDIKPYLPQMNEKDVKKVEDDIDSFIKKFQDKLNQLIGGLSKLF